MGELYAISFENFGMFVNRLARWADVYGPVKGRVVSYEKIRNSSELYFDSLAEYGAKGLFFKPGELILRYCNNAAVAAETKPQRKKVLMGLRVCDLAAIRKQDIAFGAKPEDPYYKRRRQNTLLFGYHQKGCGDEWCFCQSVDLDVSFDLMFYKRFDHYLVETGSEAGKKVVSGYGRWFEKSSYVMTGEDKKIENKLRLNDRQIADIYNSPEWEKLAERCFSCGVCNALCPTCYCFEFKDRTDSKGSFERTREQSQCQLPCFTLVAGGYSFRNRKVDRFRHRIYHQLQYFRERFGTTLCVGCGRCIRHCPTRINFITAINRMKGQKK